MQTSALIDTNLTVLLVVGLTDKSYIKSHKRTKAFAVEDYDLLVSELEKYHTIWITTHCLAETSNLLKQFHAGEELLATLARFGNDARESYIPKSNVFGNKEYIRLGVSDAGFIQKAQSVSQSFTTDIDLYLAVDKLGASITNFNHRRSYI